MWRKLTDDRYRLLIVHTLAVGTICGSWAAVIGLPFNQIAFFVIAGACIGALIPLRLLDAGITVPKVRRTGFWTLYTRTLPILLIPSFAADILVLSPTTKVLVLRLLVKAGVFGAFGALYWLAEAIDKRRALKLRQPPG